MDNSLIIGKLEHNREVFHALLEGLTEAEYSWRPQKDKWCLLEIVCHLYDEEREDFRARTRHALESPEDELQPIDPPGWVEERKYMEQNYRDRLRAFLEERDQSVKWLQSLQSPDWSSAFHHPHFGRLSAGRMLANWLAHDYLHFRQITRTKYRYMEAVSGESLDYAGKW